MPNVGERDDDSDGLNNDIEAAIGTDPANPDTDGDTILDGTDDEPLDACLPVMPNSGCLDSDSDGVVDYGTITSSYPVETSLEASNDPCAPSRLFEGCDTDGDGIVDGVEDANNNFVVDANETSFLLADSDMDGISDAIEVGDLPSMPMDTDGDGIIDARDLDSDNDGISDALEAGIPFEPVDSDNDGTPDYLDLDSDGDGVPDALEQLSSDPDQATDTDGDETPDYLDTDSDNDGLDDAIEHLWPFDEAKTLDSDGNGLSDYYDAGFNTPTDANGDGIHDDAVLVDSDGDGAANIRDPDADNDSMPDGVEAADNIGSPIVAPVNTDNDSTPDYLDLDSDNDSRFDINEASGQPLDLDNDALVDSLADQASVLSPRDDDRDGIPNYRDLDSDGDGTPDALLPPTIDDNGDGQVDDPADSDGDGLVDPVDTRDDGFGGEPSDPDLRKDSDQDGVIDRDDLDDDNDGIPDAIEGDDDADGDGKPNSADVDSDGDGHPDLLEAAITGFDWEEVDLNLDGRFDQYNQLTGQPLQQLEPVDTDQDGIPDFLDTDSDNDGIPDAEEGDPFYRQVTSNLKTSVAGSGGSISPLLILLVLWLVAVRRFFSNSLVRR